MRHMVFAILTAMIMTAGSITFFPARILGHEHWIDLKTFYPEVGETLEVYVSSGHYFPKSEHALKDDVIDRLRLLRSGADPVFLESAARKDSRLATLAASHEGVHIVHLRLKRPRAKQPNFEAKAIFVTDASKDDPKEYAVGEGLEMIPQTAISLLSPGGKLSILLVLDGEPIAGSLEIVPEKGKSAFLSTSPDSPAIIPIRTAGKYLVTAHAGGRGCSLVFEIREEKQE